ncbi:hypothetical protein BFW01_g202 [Lasiodiplodia theobromae]|uniref:Major facilitator superfamily (MFS) profile domain-containing protein n=1 Tax=Lasiodiplodia theobromae TaxID=45133 RepID=A0A8H7MBP0_9PEZI|nr:hypothetical protein BFW01_g202 [Lasiodiplodia theobromae]
MTKNPSLEVSSTPASVDPEAKDGTPQQQGLTKVEILRKSWSRKALIVAFTGLFATTFILSFIKYSTKVYDAYATSAFSKHSALATANVVYTIMNMAVYPIMAKLSDVFGRAEGFSFSILFMVLSQVLYAACQNIGTYIAGGIFESIGDTGYTIMQQIFIAETTSLIDRGLWSSLPESVTAIPTLYLGSIVGESVLKHSTWRWGYGMWALIFPFCALPLILTMFVLQRRAEKNGLQRRRLHDNESSTLPQRLYTLLWTELDLFGAFLLVVGLGLTLIPLSLTGAKNSGRWHNGSFIAMLVLGVFVLCLFVAWDARVAARPFIPFRMVRERTVVAACVLSALDFFHYSCFTTFFPSYLQVAGGYSAGHATRIDNSLRVSFQIASVLAGLAMRQTKRSQPFILLGVPLCLLGQGLQIHLVSRAHTNEASFITAKVLVGVGRACYQTAAQVSIQAVVARADVAVVTGVFFAAMNLGAAAGTSVGGAIWNNLLPEKLEAYLPAASKGVAAKVYKSIVVAQKYQKGSVEREAIDRAYRETQRVLAIAATAALAPMVGVMWGLRNVDLGKEEEEGREGGPQKEEAPAEPEAGVESVEMTAKRG